MRWDQANKDLVLSPYVNTKICSCINCRHFRWRFKHIPFNCLCVRRPSGCPSVRPSVCPSVRLLNYFSKPISSYSFGMDCFQILHRCYPQGWLPGLCFFWRSDYFWNFGEFLKFWNIGITYSNCKMYLLLQFSFNRFEIIQGSSIGYRHYGLCFFWRSN